jgi:hypothetical protein
MGGGVRAPDREPATLAPSRRSTSNDEYPTLAPHPVGQWIPNIYVGRIGQFTSRGQWENRNLLAWVKPACREGNMGLEDAHPG